MFPLTVESCFYIGCFVITITGSGSPLERESLSEWRPGERLGPTGGGVEDSQTETRSPVQSSSQSPAWPPSCQPAPGPAPDLGHIIYITTFTGDRRAEQRHQTPTLSQSIWTALHHFHISHILIFFGGGNTRL